MKKIALLFVLTICLATSGCNDDDDAIIPVSVDLNFTHNWDGDEIANSDFDLTNYINAKGNVLKISKMIYLISDVTFTDSAGMVYDAGDYNLVNVRDESNLTFTPNIQIPPGDYTVSFTFGFDDEDNIDGAYLDLNSADGGWNVPMMLGGGYHYMRFEGRFIDNMAAETSFQYHMIRSANTTVLPFEFIDSSFIVSLGQVTVASNTNIEVKMNLAEWFKNPNLWDLNDLHSELMENFDAQIMMSQNGQSAFSLGAVTN